MVVGVIRGEGRSVRMPMLLSGVATVKIPKGGDAGAASNARGTGGGDTEPTGSHDGCDHCAGDDAGTDGASGHADGRKGSPP